MPLLPFLQLMRSKYIVVDPSISSNANVVRASLPSGNTATAVALPRPARLRPAVITMLGGNHSEPPTSERTEAP